MLAPRRLLWGLLILLFLPEAGAEPAPRSELYSKLRWRGIGPYRGGRVTAVAGVPGQPLVYYFGATGGGVWKSVDGGQTWRNISDGFFRSGSVGAVAVAPSDPNVVYVGMGEACVRSNFSHGDGVYRSTDAGATWTHVGLSQTHQIGRIRVHPQNPDLLYVAALGRIFGPSPERGVYRSFDGGRTWRKVLFVDEDTGAVDLALDPHNPRVLFAAFWQVRRTPYRLISGGPGSALYRSTDGGESWTRLTRGLPEGIWGRVGVTVSPAQRGRVWAIIEAQEGGLFRSDDGGESWVRVNAESKIRERPWYYSHVVADPQDPDTVYALTLWLEKSVDGGRTFTSLRTAHADNHDLWIDPSHPLRMINGNDGGASVSSDGGRTWSSQENQPTGQFYHVTTDQRVPYRVYGAQQDNTTVSISSRSRSAGIGRRDWYPVGGGESGHIAPHPLDPDLVFAGSYYGYLSRYDHRTGIVRDISVWPETPGGRAAADLRYRFQWSFPVVIPPWNPDTLYAAANVLFKSTDRGESWQVISPDLTRDDESRQGPTGGPLTGDNSSADYYSTIFAVAPSPLRPGMIWVGSDDGLVHLTLDEGGQWQNVTPAGLPEWSRINEIEASPHDPAAAYLAVNRYQSDDYHPYIYRTRDYGKSWQLIVSGIPEGSFVRAVREDPETRGLLYCGTERGVYVSFDDGERWEALQLNLPVVPVTDLEVRQGDLVASTQGRGFWILDDLILLRQLALRERWSGNILFRPENPYRFQRLWSAPGLEPLGENPPAGLILYFFLEQFPQHRVRLEFLDETGSPIRTLQAITGEEEKVLGETFRVQAGMNRLEWDLRYPGAEPVPGDSILWGGDTRGPLAIPGEYRVRLTVGEETFEESFRILGDPALSLPVEDYRRQLELLLLIRDKISEVHETVRRINTVVQELERAGARAEAAGAEQEFRSLIEGLTQRLLGAKALLIQEKIKRGNDVLSFPVGLNSRLASLARAVGSSEGAPTNQAYQVWEALLQETAVPLEEVRQVMERDLPELNRRMAERGVPAIAPPRP